MLPLGPVGVPDPHTLEVRIMPIM